MSEVFTFGSLFTGFGGLDLGLERAGMKVLWQVENNEYAQKILEKHWPRVARFGDVRSVHGALAPGTPHVPRLQPVDLICGGFPCQDISSAGKRKGIKGDRSSLWKEFKRVIGEVRPSWVLIENVSALRSRGLSVVLQDLAELGYDAEWSCFPAAALGARVIRERLFLIAYCRTRISPTGPAEGVLAVSRCERLVRLQHESWKAQTPYVAPGTTFVGELVAVPGRNLEYRVDYGVPNRVERTRGLGNAVIPQVAEFVGRLVMESRAVLKAANTNRELAPSLASLSPSKKSG